MGRKKKRRKMSWKDYKELLLKTPKIDPLERYINKAVEKLKEIEGEKEKILMCFAASLYIKYKLNKMLEYSLYELAIEIFSRLEGIPRREADRRLSEEFPTVAAEVREGIFGERFFIVEAPQGDTLHVVILREGDLD